MDPSPLPGADELLELAPCGLLVADHRGLLLQVNGTLCRWLGQPREELVGLQRFQDLLSVGGRIFHQTHLAPLLRMQGSVAEVKLELRRKGGDALPVIVNLAERPFQQRILLHAALFIAEDRDRYEQELLSQRRRAEELTARHLRDQQDLAAARAQAEDRALFAEQMVGVVSHDLRNPLSAIHMSASLLAMAALPQQQRVVVDRIARSVARAERLISTLLDFTEARLGGGLSVAKSQVDLHEVVAEGLAELRAAFPGTTLIHLREGPGACAADADRVTQAVGNLVANAANHGASSRPITITTTGAADGMRIAVHNEGEPIAPDLLGVLFEPMVRGTVSRGRGVGLGLYIVRAIAAAHGGSVRVSSNAQEGTTFVIAIPP